jgi:hypothetical protein
VKLDPSDDPKVGAALLSPNAGAAAAVEAGAVTLCDPNNGCDWNPNPLLVVAAGVAAPSPPNADAPPNEKLD